MPATRPVTQPPERGLGELVACTDRLPLATCTLRSRRCLHGSSRRGCQGSGFRAWDGVGPWPSTRGTATGPQPDIIQDSGQNEQPRLTLESLQVVPQGTCRLLASRGSAARGLTVPFTSGLQLGPPCCCCCCPGLLHADKLLGCCRHNMAPLSCNPGFLSSDRRPEYCLGIHDAAAGPSRHAPVRGPPLQHP